MAFRMQTAERVVSMCRDSVLSMILAGIGYGAGAYSCEGSSIYDVELNSRQCILLALLYSLVVEDMMSCCLLADICHKVRQLQSDYLRVWLTGDFQFPRQDMEKAMTLLAKLLEAGELKLPPHVTRIMSSLAARYGIDGVQLMSPSKVGHRYLANLFEEAIANDSPGDIMALAIEGGDVNGSTQSGESFIYLAAKLGSAASINVLLVFLKANLEALNTSNETPLEEAVKNNDVSAVKVLLSYGAKVDKLIIRGDTYLHIAAAGAHNEALEVLLERGMDVNKKNRFHETPLFQAVKARNVRGMKMLLEKGADAGIFPEDGKSLIEMAVESKNVEIFKALVKSGAKFTSKEGDTIFHFVARFRNDKILTEIQQIRLPENVKNQNGHTPLHLASDPSIVKTLIKMGFNTNDQTKKGETALYFASANGPLELVRTLYQGGAAVDTPDDSGTSPLMIAVKNSKEDIASFLLHNGANPNMKDKGGRAALHYAAEGGCAGIVMALMDAGAEINDRDNKGDTPAFIAAVNNKTAVLRLLVENGADLALKDSAGDGILHREARSGHVEVVTALLDAGAEVDMKGQWQCTALYRAVEGGHTAVMAALLDRGADLEARECSEGWTPLMRASYSGHLAAVQLLVDRGAQLNAKDNGGLPAFYWANGNNHRAVADYLRSRGGL